MDDCKPLLQLMPASTDVQVFGGEKDAGVEVQLPFNLALRKLHQFGPDKLGLAI